VSLDKTLLAAKLQNVFQKAKAETWGPDQVASGLADAVHAYVSAAQVQGVASKVAVDVPLTGPSPVHVTTTAQQTGSVGLS